MDFPLKKIFGPPENRPALARLLNGILQLEERIEEVDILNPFSHQELAEDKFIVLDIWARHTEGRWPKIKMRVSVAAGRIKRLVYYGCLLYVDQLKTGAG